MHTSARRDEYLISTDSLLLDVDAVHAFLTACYWAEGIPRDVVARSLAGSLCFGLYHAPAGGTRPSQIGLARVITDRATFAYLCDVYVLESHRGRGLGKWLMSVVRAHPDLQGLRRFLLYTRDAHRMYARFGFTPAQMPERAMEIVDREVYKRRA